jgi:predicted porin
VPSLTGSFPSRIGFRGTEDLGGGLSAILRWKPAGWTPAAWGRATACSAATVGLKGSFGTVSIGRQINMTYIAAEVGRDGA